MNRWGLYFLFCTFFILFSCDPLPCIDTRQPSVGILFEQDSSGIILSRTISNDSLFQVFPGKSIRFHTVRTSYSNWQLSLVPNANSFWIFAFDSARRDSIHFTYQTDPFFVSKECGYRAVYSHLSVEKVSGDRFKEVIILNPRVDTSKQIHAKIILK